MEKFRLLMILLLAPAVVYCGYNGKQKQYKRQAYGTQVAPASPQPSYGGAQGGGQALPFGVVPPRIPPTYGNDKGGGGQYQDYEDSNTLPGVPGQDYPIYGPNPPLTNFNCATAPYVPGYYANVDYGCQVFHICEQGGKVNTFLCPNGTIYNQKVFVCDWWYNVNCAESPNFYGLNGELYRVPPGGYQGGGGGGAGPAVGGGGRPGYQPGPGPVVAPGTYPPIIAPAGTQPPQYVPRPVGPGVGVGVSPQQPQYSPAPSIQQTPYGSRSPPGGASYAPAVPRPAPGYAPAQAAATPAAYDSPVLNY